MAWPGVPADLSDGNVLSASWLNSLTDAVSFLQGLGGLANVPFAQATTSTQTTRYYMIRHRHRYLHLYYTSTNADFVKVWYNGTLVINDGSPPASTTYHADLNSLGLTVGQWYTITTEVAHNAGGSSTLGLLWESTNAT